LPRVLLLLTAAGCAAGRPPAGGDDPADDVLPPAPSTVEGDGAAVYASHLPTALACGEATTTTVTMQNTGTTAWSALDGYALGAVGDDPFTAALQVALADEAIVAPGGTWPFTFPLVAPSTGGTFGSDWQMVHAGVGFGEIAAASVTVDCPPRESRTGPVSLDGNSLSDDQGRFNALGATMFWAAWAYRNPTTGTAARSPPRGPTTTR
jgi:hypothetical protein